MSSWDDWHWHYVYASLNCLFVQNLIIWHAFFPGGRNNVYSGNPLHYILACTCSAFAARILLHVVALSTNNLCIHYRRTVMMVRDNGGENWIGWQPRSSLHIYPSCFERIVPMLNLTYRGFPIASSIWGRAVQPARFTKTPPISLIIIKSHNRAQYCPCVGYSLSIKPGKLPDSRHRLSSIPPC